MTRKTAKELLAASFRELANTKSINKITIQDITRNCGYTPATFYRNYRNISDVIVEDYHNQLNRILGQQGEDHDFRDILKAVVDYHWENRAYFVNLLMHMHGQEEYFRNAGRIYIKYMTEYISRVTDGKNPDRTEEFYIRQYCLGVVFLNRQWILDVFKATPEEIVDVCLNSLPVPMQKYVIH